MKKALIFVFTGTGNTMAAARAAAFELESLGFSAQVRRITAGLIPPDPREYDLLGIGYPIHAFNAPKPVCALAAALPKTERPVPVFVFKTSGEPFAPNRASSMTLARRLRRKGYDILSETHMLMPYNIMFRYPDAVAKQMYLYTVQTARMAARRAAALERGGRRASPLAALGAVVFRIQWLGARINGPLHRADGSCTGCGKCAEGCPMGNIVMEGGRPRFSNRCAMCMGCAMGCPAGSISPGFLTPWRVRGNYDFPALLADAAIPESCIDPDTRGYFRLFYRYYEKTAESLRAWGLAVPGEEDYLLTNETACGIIQHN